MTFERGDVVKFDTTKSYYCMLTRMWVQQPCEMRGRLLSIDWEVDPAVAVVHTMGGAKRSTLFLCITKVLPPPVTRKDKR